MGEVVNSLECADLSALWVCGDLSPPAFNRFEAPWPRQVAAGPKR